MKNREIKNTENGLKKISKCNLLFVGNLDLKMNYDSLKFFSDKFYPNIVKFAKREVVVNIVGFNPSNNVKRLSLENNWNLIFQMLLIKSYLIFIISHIILYCHLDTQMVLKLNLLSL